MRMIARVQFRQICQIPDTPAPVLTMISLIQGHMFRAACVEGSSTPPASCFSANIRRKTNQISCGARSKLLKTISDQVVISLNSSCLLLLYRYFIAVKSKAKILVSCCLSFQHSLLANAPKILYFKNNLTHACKESEVTDNIVPHSPLVLITQN